MNDFSDAAELISTAERILLTTHTRPDGDALGSVEALRLMIQRQAAQDDRPCTVETLLLSGVPDAYEFVLAERPLIWGQDFGDADLAGGGLDPYDLIIVADTRAVKQLPHIGDYLLNRPQGVLVIDHHLSGDEIGSTCIIDTSAAATGQILCDFFQAASWALDEQIAGALFVALSTDTGWFRFENASAAAYHVAAQLVAAGAKPDTLYHQLFQNFPPERLRLLTAALATIELHCDNRLALMHIDQAMLAAAGAKRTHIENMVNECYQVGSVIVAVLFVEQEDHHTRISFRSRHTVDVNTLAQTFGGGGHARAAGATTDLPLTQAQQAILEKLPPAVFDAVGQ